MMKRFIGMCPITFLTDAQAQTISLNPAYRCWIMRGRIAIPVSIGYSIWSSEFLADEVY
jgi:hypothetical protein